MLFVICANKIRMKRNYKYISKMKTGSKIISTKESKYLTSNLILTIFLTIRIKGTFSLTFTESTITVLDDRDDSDHISKKNQGKCLIQ